MVTRERRQRAVPVAVCHRAGCGVVRALPSGAVTLLCRWCIAAALSQAFAA